MPTQYIVSGTLKLNGEIIPTGAAFTTEDEQLEKELHKAGAILLPEEYAAAAAASGDTAILQQLADERARLASENAAKDAELARLRALVEDKSGSEESSTSESSSEPAPASSEEPSQEDDNGGC